MKRVVVSFYTCTAVQYNTQQYKVQRNINTCDMLSPLWSLLFWIVDIQLEARANTVNFWTMDIMNAGLSRSHVNLMLYTNMWGVGIRQVVTVQFIQVVGR